MDIVEVFETSWKELVNKHKRQGRFLLEGWTAEECFEETGCFQNERDVQATLFNIIKENVKSLGTLIDVHLDVKMSENQIGKKKWKQLQYKRRKEPIIDLVVSRIRESEEEPFDLCVELKYWDFFQTKTPQIRTFKKRWINYDINKLKKLLDFKVCSNAYFCFLDEYYYSFRDVSEQLANFLNAKQEKTGIRCYYNGVSREEFLESMKRRKPIRWK